MNSKTVAVLLAGALVSMAFLGCASVPKEQLDEKEAIIKNLNAEMAGLKQDIDNLRTANEEFAEKISRMENELSKRQKAAEAAEPKDAEQKIK